MDNRIAQSREVLRAVRKYNESNSSTLAMASLLEAAMVDIEDLKRKVAELRGFKLCDCGQESQMSMCDQCLGRAT